mgnify:CR=1 FL=1
MFVKFVYIDSVKNGSDAIKPILSTSSSKKKDEHCVTATVGETTNAALTTDLLSTHEQTTPNIENKVDCNIIQ